MGRPRLYPLCPKCQKSVKPDHDAGDGTHRRCPGSRGPRQPKPEAVESSQPVETTQPDEGASKELSAKDVQAMIRHTVQSRDRHVVKHEGRWYLTDDPEKGFAGSGYDTPSALLADWVRSVGFLRNQDGDIVMTIR